MTCRSPSMVELSATPAEGVGHRIHGIEEVAAGVRFRCAWRWSPEKTL